MNSSTQRYRISADALGWGFSQTVNAPSAQAALAMAQRRARHHPGAEIVVTPCGGDLSDEDRALARMFAGDRPDLVPDVDALRRAGAL